MLITCWCWAVGKGHMVWTWLVVNTKWVMWWGRGAFFVFRSGQYLIWCDIWCLALFMYLIHNNSINNLVSNIELKRIEMLYKIYLAQIILGLCYKLYLFFNFIFNENSMCNSHLWKTISQLMTIVNTQVTSRSKKKKIYSPNRNRNHKR